jgi:hypothetical protein
MASRKTNETSFKRGRRKSGGRKPGTRNKITADLGDDFLAAAEGPRIRRPRQGRTTRVYQVPG